jgi:hypothetical protein
LGVRDLILLLFLERERKNDSSKGNLGRELDGERFFGGDVEREED